MRPKTSAESANAKNPTLARKAAFSRLFESPQVPLFQRGSYCLVMGRSLWCTVYLLTSGGTTFTQADPRGAICPKSGGQNADCQGKDQFLDIPNSKSVPPPQYLTSEMLCHWRGDPHRLTRSGTHQHIFRQPISRTGKRSSAPRHAYQTQHRHIRAPRKATGLFEDSEV